MPHSTEASGEIDSDVLSQIDFNLKII